MTTPDLETLELDELAAVAAALRGLPYVSDVLAYWAAQALVAVVGERDWRVLDDHPDPPPWPPVDHLGLCDLAAIVAALDVLDAKNPDNSPLATFVHAATMQVLAEVQARIDASRQRRQSEVRSDRHGRLL